MARSIKSHNLETRTARTKLESRKKPYYQRIDRNLQVGYYRGAKSGSWVVRYHVGNSRYNEKTLGIADDVQDATGVDILDFYQAQQRAREWCNEQARIQAGVESAIPVTVAEAAEEYLDWFKSNRKSYDFTKRSIELHILPTLGKYEVRKLTTRVLQKWLNAYAQSTPQRGAAAFDPEKRKATANRQLNILKALLNYAFNHGYVESDQAWRRLKPFKGVENAKVRYLSGEECKRLVNACDGDFRLLVQAALYTGCRYGELIALKAGDYNPDSQSVWIGASKAGKPRSVSLSKHGNTFFQQVSAGKASDAKLFVKADGTTWKKSQQGRRMAEALKNASITEPASFHDLRHTYASQLAMKGVPLQVIATQLGHADTRTCEKHYAHLSPSYVADTIRAHLPDLGGVAKCKVISRWKA